ncbi:hypothetical protein H4582DRAFT_2051393 [Lactarius indigo]|nr:hypothetical protein H4582DRAFT_2051393 [Lactarius indigo]
MKRTFSEWNHGEVTSHRQTKAMRATVIDKRGKGELGMVYKVATTNPDQKARSASPSQPGKRGSPVRSGSMKTGKHGGLITAVTTTREKEENSNFKDRVRCSLSFRRAISSSSGASVAYTVNS